MSATQHARASWPARAARRPRATWRARATWTVLAAPTSFAPRAKLEQRASLRPLRRSRRLDEHVHLLADVHRERLRVERVDDLEHARVDALARVARQRALRHDVGVDAHELQLRARVSIAAHRRDRFRAFAQAPRLALVDVDAHVHAVEVAEEDQRILEHAARRELALPHVHLQHDAVDGRAHDQALALDLDLLRRGARSRDLRL